MSFLEKLPYIFSLPQAPNSHNETYKFDQVHNGQFLCVKRNTDLLYEVLELTEVLVYGLTEAVF